MRWRILIAAFILLLGLLAVPPVARGRAEDQSVNADVDVYFIDQVGITHPMLNAVRTELADIYRKAGVRLSWHVVGRDPDHEVRPERLIRVVLARRRMLMLGASAEKPGANGRVALGSTWTVDHGKHFSRTVSLPYEEIAAVAARARTSESSGVLIAMPGIQHVMARVIAHEIGHILLSQEKHTQHGIMRPDFTYSELAGPDEDEFCFSEAEAQKLRAGTVHADILELGEGN